jgi:hypothetical protein
MESRRQTSKFVVGRFITDLSEYQQATLLGQIEQTIEANLESLLTLKSGARDPLYAAMKSSERAMYGLSCLR